MRKGGAVRVLLFSLKLTSGANQKEKEKDVVTGNIKKKKELLQFIAGDACQ